MIDKEDIEAMHPEYYDITLLDTKEHEDGSATYTFDLHGKAADIIMDLGLKTLLFSGALNMSTNEMFDILLKEAQKKNVEKEV